MVDDERWRHDRGAPPDHDGETTAMTTALATFLLDLSTRAGAEGFDTETLRLHVRRADLAEYLELTTGELERAFEALTALGAVAVDSGDTVSILDRASLEREAAGGRTPGKIAGAGSISRAEAEPALRAILGDERFLSTPRTSALLVYLVEQAIADGSADLDVSRIAVEVLGRPAGFDPSDPTLRVLLTHLRKMLDEYDARAHDAALSIRLERGACRVVIEPREGRVPR